MHIRSLCAVVCVFALARVALGQDASQLFLVDFEGFDEGTEISEQFADQGVTFSIQGDPTLLPIIAVEGGGSGGAAETMVESLGDPNGAFRSVEDDPDPGNKNGNGYTGDPGDTIFTGAHRWDTCCTDGYAISDLSCEWTAIVARTRYGNSRIRKFRNSTSDPSASSAR